MLFSETVRFAQRRDGLAVVAAVVVVALNDVPVLAVVLVAVVDAGA